MCDSIYFITGLTPCDKGPVAFPTLVAAGSLMLRRTDRREHKRGLVRAKKHVTKSGSGGAFSWLSFGL